MIPHIPRQRLHSSATRPPFNDLVAYIEENKSKEMSLSRVSDSSFSQIIDYATHSLDKHTNTDKCLGLRINRLSSIDNAAFEMNLVAHKNKRCKDPTYHFILSWPEHELPDNESVFDAAEHALKALGLSDHQYVVAIHGNTDNRHCHVAVNRVNPFTHKSKHIEWARKTLHYAARQSEIKHGWTHVNGIYIVEVGEDGQKRIVLNRDHEELERDYEDALHKRHELLMPDWYSRESLADWLKGPLSKALKRDLPNLDSWQALHSWLDRYGIALKDTGGGGMRLVATLYETGEILELPTSKGLRQLKRADLETRWGAYKPPVNPSSVILPNTSHLSPSQLEQGARHVLGQHFDFSTPHDDIVHLEQHRRKLAAERTGGLHELSDRGLVSRGAGGELLLQDAVHRGLGDSKSGQDQGLRLSGPGGGSGEDRVTHLPTPSNQNRRQRDVEQRVRRRLDRAAARADLRRRYTQYKRFVRLGEADHDAKIKALRAERGKAIADINKEAREAQKAARKAFRHDLGGLLLAMAGIATAAARRKLDIESHSRHRAQEIKVSRRHPPLGWREWLHKQSNLGDQAAISALRGLVYQARRDIKKGERTPIDDYDEERAKADDAYREAQHKKLLARLIEEEKQEIAIRAAHVNTMRAHEIDALLVRYTGIQWRVTGNGNIEYADRTSQHLFTDRGNRVTFDREHVTDEEIKLALIHARQKFGNQVTFTGNDPVFTARMARLADDLDLTILNPEMQPVIAEHRQQRRQRVSAAVSQQPTPAPAPKPVQPSTQSITPLPGTLAPEATTTAPAPSTETVKEPVLEPQPEMTLENQLRQNVLAIDPQATFIVADPADDKRRYVGLLAATAQAEDQPGFAQHIGRHRYALHKGAAPENPEDRPIEVVYRDSKRRIHILKGQGIRKE